MKPENAAPLHIRPTTLKVACEYVGIHHRHAGSPRGGRWAIAVHDIGGVLRGVAIVARPCARLLDDGLTAEVTRLATDGTANACSCLYGAARRIARAMGYQRVLTYTRIVEPGTSLRAAGWRLVAEVKAIDRPGGAARPGPSSCATVEG